MLLEGNITAWEWLRRLEGGEEGRGSLPITQVPLLNSQRVLYVFQVKEAVKGVCLDVLYRYLGNLTSTLSGSCLVEIND